MTTTKFPVTSPDLPKMAENENTALVTVGPSGLTVSRIEELMVAHQASVKLQSMVRMVNAFALTETDVDLILEARGEYSAGVAKMRQLLERGFTALQINNLYEARERINAEIGSGEYGVSIQKLLVVRDTFMAADCDPDSLCEIVLAIYRSAGDMSLERALHTACYIANRSDAVMLETVLDLVRTYVNNKS